MGDRSFIEITSKRLEEPIHLYGHWAGTSNFDAVKNVLERTDRVGDPSYLTAQLFYEFAVELGNYDGSLGFGIGVGACRNDGDNPTVTVDADTGTITYRGDTFPLSEVERRAHSFWTS